MTLRQLVLLWQLHLSCPPTSLIPPSLSNKPLWPSKFRRELLARLPLLLNSCCVNKMIKLCVNSLLLQPTLVVAPTPLCLHAKAKPTPHRWVYKTTKMLPFCEHRSRSEHRGSLDNCMET